MYQNFSAQISQFLPSRQRYMCSDVVIMKDNAFSIDSILTTFPESIASIALVADSRDQNQSFCLAAMNDFFLIPPDSITFFGVNPSFALITFSNIIVAIHFLSSVINLFRNVSILFQRFTNENLVY